jgi:hypothetical protein
MTAVISAEFIAELEKAAATGSLERRRQTLRGATDLLLLATAERLDAAVSPPRSGSAADITKLMLPHVTNGSLAMAGTGS